MVTKNQTKIIKYNEKFLAEFSHKFSSYDGGQAFFDSLVTFLYDVTGLDYVLVGGAARDDDGKFIIKTIALAAFGELTDNITYPMWKGPCYEVVRGKVYSYPSKCREIFPENKTLVQLNVEGYLGYPLCDGNGKSIGLIAIMHGKEIEDHDTISSILKIVAKRAEFELNRVEYEKALEKRNAELQLSTDRLQSTFDGVPAMIALLDAVYDADHSPIDFVISAANKATSDFTGLQTDELIGKKMTTLYPETWSQLVEKYLDVFSTGKPLQLEFFNAELKKWFSIFVTRQADGKGVVSCVLEITAQKKAEEERKQNVLLTELDRAKTEFFSNVSHELRTPLTLLLGPIEDILTNKSIAKIDRTKLEMVHRNALRLQKLVNSLLDFSRIESGRFDTVFQPTNVSAFTTMLAANFSSAIENAGLRFIVHCESVEPVYVNRNMWEKIVFNLLSNAFKFTFEGTIEISIRSIKKHIQLHVRDTGIGISPENISKIFLRFVRIENSKARTYEGSGIGLALVKELVSMHGGTIKVKSKIGAGSEFIVSIPKGKKHLPGHMIHELADNNFSSPLSESFRGEAINWLPEKPSNLASDPTDNAKPTVLMVDDNSDLRNYIRGILKYNFVIVEACNGSQALGLLNNGFRPDLILSDIMMPEMNGFEFLEAVKRIKATSNLPFVFLSAKASEQERIHGLRAGADHYLVKPFSARELLAIVKSKVAKNNGMTYEASMVNVPLRRQVRS